MKYKSFFVLTLAIVFFYSCITSGYNSSENSSQNTTSITNTSNRTGNITAYVLENDERLSTFIVAQNDLNEYAKHENEPTVRFYKEKFTEFENLTREVFNEHLKEISEDDMKEFQQEFPGISFNEFIDIFRKIVFFYKIEYNRNLRVWHIELIGRSTTLRLDFANTRREGMSYYHRVVPYVNRWMELNNVEDLDFVLRVYINDIDGDTIPELFGIPFDD
jgi:hypothetical protein